jgi:hypothetical protein
LARVAADENNLKNLKVFLLEGGKLAPEGTLLV